MTEEAIRVLLVEGGRVQKHPGMIMRVISDRKWPLKKRPVIAHIKARSKHSFLTINHNDLKINTLSRKKEKKE